MTRVRSRSLLALTLVAAAGIAAAQTPPARPDFSGTWKMDEPRSGSPGHTPFVSPVIWIVQQQAGSMLVEVKTGPSSTKYTYELQDGPSTSMGAPGSSRGYFDGAQLITESLVNIQGKTVTMRQTWTRPSGDEMVVERIVEVEHGYAMRQAQNYSSVRDVFVRVP